MQIAAFLDRWLGRFSSLWTFTAPLVPGTIGGIFMGYLSRGVGLINQFGWFGWCGTGIVTFVLISFTVAALSRSQLWRMELKARKRLSDDSSPFDAMARVYENKRLYLRDLAPLGRKQVVGKKFIGCEIIGPGTVVLGLRSNDSRPFPSMKDCNTLDVDVVEIDPSRKSLLAVEFIDCDFDACNFYHMTLLFTQRDNESLHWITPAPVVAMIEDMTDEKEPA